MGRLALFLASLAIVFSGATARADGEGDRNRNRQKEFEQVEEQLLKQQLENFLNEGARWDKDRKRIILKDSNRDLGGMEVPLTAMLQGLAEPGDDGRLHIREGVKLRPFMKVIQDFIADGGMEDIEKIQRMRREGSKENPFKGGIPPRMTKAIAGLLKALNEQGRPDADDGEKKDERVAGRGRGGAGNGDRDGAEDGDRARGRDERRAEARERSGGSPRSGGTIEERIAERLRMKPEELEARLRVARDLAQQAAEEAQRRLEEFAASEQGQRLRRRAESEIRRLTDSDEFKQQMADLQKRALDFFSSEEGRNLQKRIYEFLETEQGRELRRRLDDFLQSEEGKKLAERLGDMFSKGNPFERRPGQGGEKAREGEKVRQPKEERAPERKAEQKKSGSKLF